MPGRLASMLSTISSGCADRITSRCCLASTCSSENSICESACASSSASTWLNVCDRIARIDKQLGASDNPESLALRQRAARLRGALIWRQETEYPERLTAAYKHLQELNAPVDALNRQYDAFVRARQAATHSYVGYDVQIARLRESVSDASQRVDILIARQGHMIETVAINQLEARRERLVAQQAEARFGVADSYDRAARAQSGAGGH